MTAGPGTAAVIAAATSGGDRGGDHHRTRERHRGPRNS